MVRLNLCTPCGVKKVKEVIKRLEDLFSSKVISPETCCICCKPILVESQTSKYQDEECVNVIFKTEVISDQSSAVAASFIPSTSAIVECTTTCADITKKVSTMPITHDTCSDNKHKSVPRATRLRTGAIKKVIFEEESDDDNDIANPTESSEDDYDLGQDLCESSDDTEATIDFYQTATDEHSEQSCDTKDATHRVTNAGDDGEQEEAGVVFEKYDDSSLKLQAFTPEVLELLDTRRDDHDEGHNKPFKCRHCDDEQWSYLNPLLKHLLKHSTKDVLQKPFQCKSCCNSKFETFADWTRHTKPYQCRHPSCELKLSSSNNLREHEKTHSSKRPFQCKDCGRQFRLSSYLGAHEKIVHSQLDKDEESAIGDTASDFEDSNLDVNNQDEQWGEGISERHILKFKALATEVRTSGMVKSSNPRKPFGCRYCKKRHGKKRHYSDIFQYLEHMSKVHKNDMITKPYQCKECCEERFKTFKEWELHTKPYKCSYPNCNTKIKSRTYLKTHERAHTDEKTVLCKLCEKTFKSKYGLRVHIRSVHEGIKRFSCSYCDHKFYNRASCILHERTHTKDKPYQCYCGKQFTSAHLLMVHNMDHTGEKPFVCDICGFRTKTKNNLVCHQKTHNTTIDMKLQCDICGLRVTKNLKGHRRIHTGEKQYKCRYCDKAFMYPPTLKQHEKTHSEWNGIREYVCGECGKDLHSKQKLKKHARIHSGEKPFHCPDCNFTCSCAGNLRTHRRRHTGEQPYQCKVCEKRFMYIQPWKDHEKICSVQRLVQVGSNMNM